MLKQFLRKLLIGLAMTQLTLNSASSILYGTPAPVTDSIASKASSAASV